MPNYYSPYALYPATYPVSYGQQPTYSQAPQSSQNYMTYVDGEVAARAWQMPYNIGPNTIIPLWDLDGKHVYFKSTDAYGRINPMKKGVVVFEDEAVEQKSEETKSQDMSQYVTKDDLDRMKQELRSMMKEQRSNQNGSRNNENRGESR